MISEVLHLSAESRCGVAHLWCIRNAVACFQLLNSTLTGFKLFNNSIVGHTRHNISPFVYQSSRHHHAMSISLFGDLLARTWFTSCIGDFSCATMRLTCNQRSQLHFVHITVAHTSDVVIPNRRVTLMYPNKWQDCLIPPVLGYRE